MVDVCDRQCATLLSHGRFQCDPLEVTTTIHQNDVDRAPLVQVLCARSCLCNGNIWPSIAVKVTGSRVEGYGAEGEVGEVCIHFDEFARFRDLVEPHHLLDHHEVEGAIPVEISADHGGLSLRSRVKCVFTLGFHRGLLEYSFPIRIVVQIV